MSIRATWPFAAVGFVLSCYALYVEHKIAHKSDDEMFTSLCDIEQLGASCSTVFQLPEGRMLSYFKIVPNGHVLDVPNAALGFVYYLYWMLLRPSLPNSLTLLIASLAGASSVFLLIQLMLLKEFCILCLSTHVINARLWWSAYYYATQSNIITTSSQTKKLA